MLSHAAQRAQPGTDRTDKISRGRSADGVHITLLTPSTAPTNLNSARMHACARRRSCGGRTEDVQPCAWCALIGKEAHGWSEELEVDQALAKLYGNFADET
eukprot:jgi/Ulvmu1/10773/UM069_0007.1